MSITHDQVLSDLSRHQAATDRAEARELALHALSKEEYEWLTETSEGLDELLAKVLDAPKDNLFKAGFLAKLCRLMVKADKDEAIALRAYLRVAAEGLSDERAYQRARDLERQPADWDNWPY